MAMDNSQNTYTFDSLPQQLCIEICVSIIEETLNQLHVLRRISKIPDMSIKQETYKTISERFSEPKIQTAQEEGRTKDERHVLAFQTKFSFLESVLKMAFNELIKTGSFETLVNSISIHKKLNIDEVNLRSYVQKKQAEVKDLNVIVYRERIFYQEKIEEVMNDIKNLNDKINGLIDVNNKKTKYTKEWENAKIEELETILTKKEQILKNTVRTTEAEMFREKRVHEEILKAVSVMQKDLEQQTEMWEEKYATSIKQINENIAALKEKQNKQRAKAKKLRDMYVKRQTHINDYKQYKIDQEQKKVELEIRNKAAIKIQAWWRGIMVRKGFGKFRKKDKKGKKRSP